MNDEIRANRREQIQVLQNENFWMRGQLALLSEYISFLGDNQSAVMFEMSIERLIGINKEVIAFLHKED